MRPFRMLLVRRHQLLHKTFSFKFKFFISAHLNHIKLVAGVDYVGLGAGYDGINL